MIFVWLNDSNILLLGFVIFFLNCYFLKLFIYIWGLFRLSGRIKFSIY